MLFVVAAVLAASYLVFVEHYRVPALAGNAVVIVFSALIVVPVYLLGFESKIPSAPVTDVAYQALFQGVLMSTAYVATHQAVLKLGGARVSMIMASIPDSDTHCGTLDRERSNLCCGNGCDSCDHVRDSVRGALQDAQRPFPGHGSRGGYAGVPSQQAHCALGGVRNRGGHDGTARVLGRWRDTE